MKIVDLLDGISTPREAIEERYNSMTMHIYPERIHWGDMSVALDPPDEVVGLQAILEYEDHSLVLYFLDSCMPHWLLEHFMVQYYPSFSGSFQKLLMQEPHVQVVRKLKEYLI